MTLRADVEALNAKALLDRQQSAWQKQRQVVLDRSPFYQRLWSGYPPPDQLLDLAELPLSSKEMLRESQAAHPPFGDYLATDRTMVSRLHRTSGTTGQAMNLALSRRDCEITQVVGGRSHRAAGLKPEDTVVHCLNYQMWMGGVSDHLTLEDTGAMVVPFGVGGSELLVRTIRELRITAISCTPSYPAVLERVIADIYPGLKPRDLGLRLGLFGGEAGLDDVLFRDRIRETWGMEPRNANYGVSDVLSNFAAQCEHDSRLHFLAGDMLYPELIDPETGTTLILESGSVGELVLTHLERECQPLVRFRTGDIIAIDETDPCECGRTGFRFRVVGRSDDMVTVRGLNIFPTMIASVINEFEALSGDYRIVLAQQPPYDILPVQVELSQFGERSPVLAETITQRIKSVLGVTAAVTLLAENSFPKTEGKTKRVIREFT